MMEPAKDRMRNNISDPLDRAYAGRVLLERNMRSHLVITDGIFSAKVLRVECYQMNRAFVPDRPDEHLSNYARHRMLIFRELLEQIKKVVQAA